MAQWLGALTSLAEDIGSVIRTPIIVYLQSHLTNSSLSDALLWSLCGMSYRTHMTHCRRHIYTKVKKISSGKFKRIKKTTTATTKSF